MLIQSLTNVFTTETDLDLRADALRNCGVSLAGTVCQLLAPGPLAGAEGGAVSQEVSAAKKKNLTW